MTANLYVRSAAFFVVASNDDYSAQKGLPHTLRSHEARIWVLVALEVVGSGI